MTKCQMGHSVDITMTVCWALYVLALWSLCDIKWNSWPVYSQTNCCSLSTLFDLEKVLPVKIGSISNRPLLNIYVECLWEFS